MRNAEKKEETVESSEPDPWLRTVTTNPSAQGAEQDGPSQLVTRGPTYKVDLTVDGVHTRGLFDHGAQVSLVRKELLATIKEHHGWSREQCSHRNLKMKLQPIGADPWSNNTSQATGPDGRDK